MRTRVLERLTDEQWKKLEPLLPREKPGKKGGRPWADNRAVFEGILWILKSGARWKDLPPEYPSPATCWRRLNKWEQEGVFEDVWREYLRQLDARKLIDWQESFIDATFFPAKRGVSKSARLAKGRAQSAWWWQAARGFHSEFSPRLRTLTSRLSQKKRSEIYGYLARDEVVPARLLFG
jgi:transposase